MKMRTNYKNITKDDIQLLSDKLEIKLPEDYEKFLLIHNGGQPEENHFLKKDAEGEIIFDFNVNSFYGIHEDNMGNDILTMFALSCDKIPEELLPIGDDGVGNIICIGVDSDYFGKVYIWWRDGQSEEPSFENTRIIDNSFQEFLQGLETSQ